MIKKYENAGIAGISIEDKIFPKQNSLLREWKTRINYQKKNLLQKLLQQENLNKIRIL